MTYISNQILKAAKRVRLIILDVDGVLTDGTLAYTKDGEQVKNFNAKDGLGIKIAQDVGIEFAVITARKNPILTKRMDDLKISLFYEGYNNKTEAFSLLQKKISLPPNQIAYVGDDVLDLPVMNLVGMPIAVADAHASAKDAALYITNAQGGKGAVREVTDLIISSRMDLETAYNNFLNKHIGIKEINTQ